MPENKQKEYWKWEESRWHNPNLNWKKAGIITAGIDVGSVSSQAAIMCDGELYAFANMRTGSNSPDSALNAIDRATAGTGLTLENIHYTVGTGYGRINIPFANRDFTEIACHARGCNYMYGPTVRTILDMGGQDCKAIRCNHQGRVTNFMMNDKCAAGTGRGMEVIADLLGVPIGDVGARSLAVDEEPAPVSSTCVVFAKTEAAGLLRAGWPVERVLAAYCSATVNRVLSLLERVGVEIDFAITGGIAKNSGIVSRLENKLGIKALKPRYDTQLAGAIGAALFAKNIAEKAENRKT
jgi:bzd-type benzoyl-CoA reductase Q subunit